MSSLYFDNAATSYPKPKCVYRTVSDALVKCGGNPGRSTHREAENSARTVYEAREAVCRYFNASEPNKVFFSLNATAALNTVILGLTGQGGIFLVSDIEHNAVLRPVAEKCKRDSAIFKIFKTYRDDPEKTINSFLNQLSDNMRCVAVNAASNVDGRVLPIKEMGEICKDRNIPFIIDASQLAGHRRIDMRKLHCSVLCCAGHKGLLSPMGCGFGIIGDIDTDFSPLTYGGNGINSKDIYIGEELPERYESGTVGVPGIAGLLAGIEHLEKVGCLFEKLEKRNTDLIVKRLSAINCLDVIHATDGVPVISIFHRTIDSEDIAIKLSERGIAVRAGFHCAPLAHHSIGTYDRGTVRISPSAFNTVEDCIYLTDCIKSVIL